MLRWQIWSDVTTIVTSSYVVLACWPWLDYIFAHVLNNDTANVMKFIKNPICMGSGSCTHVSLRASNTFPIISLGCCFVEVA